MSLPTTILRCPEGCHDVSGDMTGGVSQEFEYVDGTTGENRYCQNCGAGLVEIQE